MVAAICDDDIVWVKQEEEILRAYAQKTFLELQIEIFSSREELLLHEDTPIDIIFMDIELGQDSGIMTAKEVNEKWKNCQIVYVTNYLFYATDVYNTEHSFFVLKDQFADRIADIFQKILHVWHQRADRLIFSVIGKTDIILCPGDIYYFERDKRVTNIVTVWGVYTVWDKLDDIMDRLSPIDFARCHNSYIVYFPAVREIRKNAFILNNEQKIVISRSYMKSVREQFMKWAVTQIS